MRGVLWLLAGLVLGSAAAAEQDAAPPALEAFLAKDVFETIKLSPTGRYYAVSQPSDDHGTVLVVYLTETRRPHGAFSLGETFHVADFWWANDERLVVSGGESSGSLEQPVPTGELFAVNADGSGASNLFGYRASQGQQVGSNIPRRQAAYASAFVIDPLPDVPDEVLIAVWPWQERGARSDPYTQVERLNIHNGRRQRVARAPVQRASFVADQRGEVRLAVGAGADNNTRTYYRDRRGSDWQLINDEAASGVGVYPLGFDVGGRHAYLQVEMESGPDAIERLDTETGLRTQVLRHEASDPRSLIWSPDGRTLLGARFEAGHPESRYFDPEHPDARLVRSLEAAFEGHTVVLSSFTRDGATGLLYTESDRSPGDYYFFDAERKSADFFLSRRAGIDPRRMGERRPVAITARDGLLLHGYLTLPAGSDGRNLPLIVNPHGGPFTIVDTWAFDLEPQLLAAQGYAVLQVNFRGSGGYGRGFVRAGFQQWGRAMQDDLTDATRWAVDQGVADPARTCIYGGSYGAYAALMGVAKEPGLYRCAVGYVGVYDLALMHRRGDIPQRRSGRTFLRDALGSQDLAAHSPTRLADRIRVPVFLAAGGADKRAPVDHTEAMARALEEAGVPVETLIYRTEGHGFYGRENRLEYYRRLLDFFDAHIGETRTAAR
ncbi:alpha/beta hydrolase family protein [Coralloluteibacterium thermophilus]|uniref:Alpha/beta hydrolase family protein n=1 Tax=Coralloluteibacterium thermophilum TaxID=2707049 RepID=A0ABV9NIQ9_9GAMM